MYVYIYICIEREREKVCIPGFINQQTPTTSHPLSTTFGHWCHGTWWCDCAAPAPACDPASAAQRSTRCRWYGRCRLSDEGEQKYGGFLKLGTPIAGWFTMEHPTQMDDLGGSHILGNLYIYIYNETTKVLILITYHGLVVTWKKLATHDD